MKLILFGPPGSGKGTQAQKMVQRMNIPQISTGDMIRENISKGTELGKMAKEIIDGGNLLNDDVMIPMVQQRLDEPDCQNGYILDGFPRTIPQAEELSKFAEIDKVILLEVNDEDIVTRLTGRRVCNCGATYHVKNNPPKEDNVCDKCGGILIIRDDDKEETIRRRLDIYHSQTSPLVNFYNKSGKVFKIDGSRNIDTVFEEIMVYLKQ